VVLSARGTDINLFTTYPLIRRWIVYALKNCDHIIAVSNALKNVMVEIGIDSGKIEVIPNGVDAGRFRPIPKSEARNMLGIPQQATMLLSVGSLRPLKGFQYLLPAFKKLRVSRGELDLRLYIVGHGEYRKTLKQQVARLELQPYVKLTGRIPHQQLYKWYNAADIFCLASSREGWPNVVMESLACGLPVVATRVGGIPEILHSENLGLLLDATEGPQLEDQLLESIQMALSRNWNREELVNYVRGHTWEAVAQKVEGVLRQTLSDRNRGRVRAPEDRERHELMEE
jgi:glycosyltransferase involved in cell wall biosynthesis